MNLEEIEARRAARRLAADAARDAQKAIDTEALDALEIEHGDYGVAVLEVPYTAGLPVLAVVRVPRSVEIKRYRATVKPRRDGSLGDTVAAAEALAAVCLCYPDAETFERMCEARPGIKAQLGLAALGLAAGRQESEGKE